LDTINRGADFTLTLSCADRRGIVSAVAGFLDGNGCTIVDSQQFGDEATGQFFMRVHLRSEVGFIKASQLGKEFESVAQDFGMSWELHDSSVQARLLIMVSKQGHCLNDLLFRVKNGALNAEVVAVVSNHKDFEDLVRWHGLPFHHLPVTPDTKAIAEMQLRELVDKYSVDLVVLARYMQILSEDLCHDLLGRAINIHHSLLPSFKGAQPYAQAHARGVKVIGATAHYVTADLDEGPIIEQAFVQVDHSRSIAELTAIGRDLEAMALARAVQWHAQHRILLYGKRTVVFN
jgi:formyltetrahydrofolate deformylase